MSSRADVKKWMTFCKHLREAIIDEQKAPPSYENLIEEAKRLPIDDIVIHRIGEIIKDEKRHKDVLTYYFDKVCPRMAVHRKGIKMKREIAKAKRDPYGEWQTERRMMEG